MRNSWAGAAALLLVCSIAQAGEADLSKQAENGKMSAGVGIICNTMEQAKDYVRLRGDGAEVTRAVNTVNESAHDPKACGLAAVAFVRDATVDTRHVNGTLTSIVRINVIAGYNGDHWARVPALIQYAVMEAPGISIQWLTN
jgi:hypothetical protein